jgi:glucuronate isomerase
MDTLINDDFLLKSKFSRKLYHEFAEEMPIFDYHCHIDPQQIAENKQYENITELWLGKDHYKWRAMRSNGVDEKYITGGAPPKEKFKMWAYTMEYLIGNPLFHWTQLELKRYFGIDDLLSSDNYEYIYDKINEMLKEDRFRCKNIISGSGVKALCTTDDPMDSLEHHALIADSGYEVKVLPAFRPDKLIYIERDPYLPYIVKIENEYDVKLVEFEMLLEFLEARIEFFHKNGCRLSDHSLEPPVHEDYTISEVSDIYKKRLSGKKLTDIEIRKYKTAVVEFLGRHYSRRDWVMQIHIGVRRNLNTRMFEKLGPDTGYDGIDDHNYMPGLVKTLDMLEINDSLPKTIIYCLNPRDNDMITSVIGGFQKGPHAGKLQFGSAWWFNDTKDGMESQILALCGQGLLSRFVGMLTDSRSFLSYTRHEYFRRILCDLLGKWVNEGEIPWDEKLLGRMVQDISFINAKHYFTGCL